MDKINRIINNNRIIVEESKKKISANKLKDEAFDYRSTFSSGHEFQKLLKEDKCNLICEYKVASPSKGHISNLSLEEIVNIYDKAPVDAISILTERLYFNRRKNCTHQSGGQTDNGSGFPGSRGLGYCAAS